MQKLEMNEKIKEIYMYINYHLINIRFEKKKKKTDKNSNICTWSFDQSKVSKSVEKKNHKSEGKTFLQVIKPHVIINNEFIKSYENFFFQNFSFIR